MPSQHTARTKQSNARTYCYPKRSDEMVLHFYLTSRSWKLFLSLHCSLHSSRYCVSLSHLLNTFISPSFYDFVIQREREKVSLCIPYSSHNVSIDGCVSAHFTQFKTNSTDKQPACYKSSPVPLCNVITAHKADIYYKL